ncbi:hypothetical protein HOLleu_23856 [Holothuria leucospilota]|uniref:MYND-type domain-containing protein n=1 Tax=Holothuria leucospilota TaxID=206669 RepID=A0A9Q1H361_HOLLE|nr:hypothetical protein HOLleu_23856 [Holothuria leucospilota]
MDTAEGLCWRCNYQYTTGYFRCYYCHVAKYCSETCARDDHLRHGSVECQMWSPKCCEACKQSGATVMKCSGCYARWYCNEECQQHDIKQHQLVCLNWQRRALNVQKIKKAYTNLMYGWPCYFSCSLAKDLLNLRENELKHWTGSDTPRNLTNMRLDVLLPACGDLRHVIKTVQSLPSEFTGVLRFAVNDIDPFVTARNVLILFMIATFAEGKASAIASVWLSLRLSTEDFAILRETLSTLITMDPVLIRTKTDGLIDISMASFTTLREVWMGWKRLQCFIGHTHCIQLGEERNEMLRSISSDTETFLEYLTSVHPRHVPSIKKWYKDGIIVSSKHQDTKLKYYNPTFTGRSKDYSCRVKELKPRNINFIYCVAANCVPFQIWDYLDMFPICAMDSITSMCHAFTVHCIINTMGMMTENRLKFNIITENFLHLGSRLPKYENFEFDRIYTSDLIDYYGTAGVLKPLEPLLNKYNPCAALITETENWTDFMEEADFPSDSLERLELLKVTMIDNKHKQDKCIPRDFQREYYNNTSHFINFLRGAWLAESENTDSIGHMTLPIWSEFAACQNLILRDFSKERNHVLAFKERVNARAINMIRGSVRTLEWYRKTVQTRSIDYPQIECTVN